jgi:hypothetical protein
VSPIPLRSGSKQLVSAAGSDVRDGVTSAPLASSCIAALLKSLPSRLCLRITDPGSGDQSKVLSHMMRKLAERVSDDTTIECVIRAHLNRIGAPGTRTQNDLDLRTARTRSKTTHHAASSKRTAEQNRGLLFAWSVGPADVVGVSPCRLGCKGP